MNIKKIKNAKIKLAKEDKLKEADFEARNIGHRISIVVPEDILMAFRKAASGQGIGYQTLMNQVLRGHIVGEDKVGERLERLEKAVFNQAGRR